MPSELARLYDEYAPALFAFILNFTRDARAVLLRLAHNAANRPELAAERLRRD